MVTLVTEVTVVCYKTPVVDAFDEQHITLLFGENNPWVSTRSLGRLMTLGLERKSVK